MLDRRSAIGALTVAVACPRVAFAQGSDFTALFGSTLKDHADLLRSGAVEREAQQVTSLVSGGRGPRPHYPKSAITISPDAERLIVACEVTDEATYRQLYRHPEWPGGKSGVTVGIGYDAGWTDAKSLEADWAGRIPPAMIATLASSCALKGESAHAKQREIRSKVDIPWDTAISQFRESTLPLYIAQTFDPNLLPKADRLKDPDCRGALVSLVFNRGPSFMLAGDRHKEMRALRLHIVQGRLDLVPADLRSMKHIWANDPNAQGLVIRRELEARLFERGLANGGKAA